MRQSLCMHLAILAGLLDSVTANQGMLRFYRASQHFLQGDRLS